jgi:uncharacterized protein
MLDFSVQTQLDFLEWIELGGVTLFDIRSHHLPEIRQIIDKYSDLPPDLADVTLLVVARELNISEIITLDSDFLVYRTSDRKRFVNLLDLQRKAKKYQSRKLNSQSNANEITYGGKGHEKR